jgi:hypothetical protein
MVDELPKMTWSDAFDVTNVEDVPFTHSANSYLYFQSALNHKYTSAPLSLLNSSYINIYYQALGDVNSSLVPTSGFNKTETALELAYTDEIAVRKGDVITVPVRISQEAEVAALTLNLSYNNKLIEVVGVNFEQDYYRIDQEAGTLNIGWFSMQPSYFAAGESIALIDVRVLADITANERFFTLEAETELADIEAMPINGIIFETSALNTATSVIDPQANDLFVTNYPNPFRNTTMISYYLPTASQVQLVVFNKMGQMIETLVDDNQAAGAHKVEFDRSDLMPGVYYYKIVVSGDSGVFSETNSMILIR